MDDLVSDEDPGLHSRFVEESPTRVARLGFSIDRLAEVVILTQVDVAGIRERLVGDIKRLETLHASVVREVNNAKTTHDELHKLDHEHLTVAREAQEHRNQALNNERARQSSRDAEFARAETVNVEVGALRSQIEKNEIRIRELELGQRAILSEDSGAQGSKRSGQATVQQLMGAVGLIVAVVAIIVTIVIANITR